MSSLGNSPEQGRGEYRDAAGASAILFRRAGITDAAIRELKAPAHGRAMATIIASEKLSPSAARTLSEILKRDSPPFSLESLKLLAGISTRDLVQRMDGETPTLFLERQRDAFSLIINLISKTYSENSQSKACLGKGALDNLLEVVSKGPSYADLTLKVLRAVSKSSPGNEAEAVSLLATHRGRWEILEQALSAVADTYDLFTAARRLQLIVVSDEMRRQHAASSPQSEIPGDKRDADTARKVRESVALASGFVSTSRDLFCFMNNSEPGKMLFLAGFATPHLAETLFGGKYKGRNLEQRTEERSRRAHALFEQITLKDLLENPQLEQDIGSPLVGRALRVYQELISEQQRLRQEILDELNVVSGDKILEFIASLQLRSDDPSSILRRVQKAINEEPNQVPDMVQTAFKNLANPYTELGLEYAGPEQHDQLERACWRTLALWVSHRECVRSDLMLQPHLEDVREWKKLKSADPLRAKYDFRALEETLSAMSRKRDSIISHADYGNLLTRYDLLGFRTEMNARIWERYGSAVERATDKFRPLFKDKNRWREDMIGLKVPVRVLNSFWGSKLCRNLKEDGGLLPAVRQSEFRALLRAELLLTSFVRDAGNNQLLRSAGVKEFRTIMRTAALALKKAETLERAFAEFNDERRKKGQPKISINDYQDISGQIDELIMFRPRIISPGKTELGDKVGLEEDINPRLALPLTELGRRLADARLSMFDRRGDPSITDLLRMAEYAQNGLFKTSDRRTLINLAERCKDLIPRNDPSVRPWIRVASAMLASPLVSGAPQLSAFESYRDRQYFSPQEAKAIYAVAQEVEFYRSLNLHRTRRAAELKARRDSYLRTTFYRGKFEQGFNLELVNTTEQFDDPIRSPQGSFFYWDPAKLAEQLQRIDNQISNKEMIAAADLDDRWFSKAKYLCSRPAALKYGYTPNEQAYRSMRHAGPGSNVYYSREFVDAVRYFSTKPQTAEPGPVFIGQKKTFRWQDGILLVNFTKPQKDKPVIEVALKNPAFFTEWVKGLDFLEPEVKEVGYKAVEIAQREFPEADYPRDTDFSQVISKEVLLRLNEELGRFIQSR